METKIIPKLYEQLKCGDINIAILQLPGQHLNEVLTAKVKFLENLTMHKCKEVSCLSVILKAISYTMQRIELSLRLHKFT